MKTLEDVFDVVSSKRSLDYLHLYLFPQIRVIPSEDQVANVKHSFTEFLNKQAARLYYFDVLVSFEESENDLGIVPFTYIPEFIQANKEKVEKYERFYVWIYSILLLMVPFNFL